MPDDTAFVIIKPDINNYHSANPYWNGHTFTENPVEAVRFTTREGAVACLADAQEHSYIPVDVVEIPYSWPQN